jgi:methylated-DNA-[protein]-cysteine S-methyltransferase
MGVIGSSLGLKEIIMPRKSKGEVLLQVNFPCNLIEENESVLFADLPQRLKRFLVGELVDFPDKLNLDEASSFQQNVWKMAQAISYGETRSYGWVASQIGNAKVARAVGQALGKNPLPIIIPCHRVVSADGSLGGFSGGLNLKKYLLRLEARNRMSYRS